MTTVRVTAADGTQFDVTITPVDTPTPTPTPTPVPVTVTAVRIGTAAYPVAGVNVERKTDDLVVLTGPAGGLTSTNEWGSEVTVQGSPSAVTRTNDRQAAAQAPGAQPGAGTQGTPYVADGYLLSGHGKARDWLLANARIGTSPVLIVGPTPAPAPTPTPAPSGRTIAVYVMDGVGHVSQVPPECNQIRVAFAQGTPLRLAEWGGDTPAQTAAELAAWRTRTGGRVLLSVGGSGGAVSTSDRAAFIAAVESVGQQLPLDGIDWDIEASAVSVADVVAISTTLAGRHPSWTTAFVPSGGPPVATYLDAAMQCYRAGLAVQFGQQLYDAPVTQAVAIDCTRRAIDAGLPPSSVLVGMMIAPDASHWTVAQCEANMRAIRAVWPRIGGAYLWESSRAGTTEWATAMSRALA